MSRRSSLVLTCGGIASGLWGFGHGLAGPRGLLMFYHDQHMPRSIHNVFRSHWFTSFMRSNDQVPHPAHPRATCKPRASIQHQTTYQCHGELRRGSAGHGNLQDSPELGQQRLSRLAENDGVSAPTCIQGNHAGSSFQRQTPKRSPTRSGARRNVCQP